MQRQDYTQLTNEQLQEHYANTGYTRAMCSGHSKTEWNDRRNKMARDEMKQRGIEPDGRKGTFNGTGAY